MATALRLMILADVFALSLRSLSYNGVNYGLLWLLSSIVWADD